MLTTASVVAGDASAHMTTSMANTIATEHSYLMMCVLASGSTSARSKFPRECDVACGQYRRHGLKYQQCMVLLAMSHMQCV